MLAAAACAPVTLSLANLTRSVGIDQRTKSHCIRHQLTQQHKPLWRKLHAHGVDAGDISTWAAEIWNQPSLHRVRAAKKAIGTLDVTGEGLMTLGRREFLAGVLAVRWRGQL
jgi:hypothetical protein